MRVTLGEVIFTDEPWGPYTYRLPPNWEHLNPGVRVKVPLRNSFRIGLLVAVYEGEDSPRYKDIAHPYDETPLLTPLLIEFTRWLAEYYLCEWGEVVALAIPPGLKPTRGVKYRLSEAGKAEEWIGREGGVTAELWRRLYREPLTFLQVKRRYPEGEKLWEKFRQRGWLEPVWSVKAVKQREELVWEWDGQLDYARALELLPPNARQLRQAIELLRQQGGSLSRSELSKRAGKSTEGGKGRSRGMNEAMRRLVERGWVKIKMVEKIPRDPYGAGIGDEGWEESVMLTPEQRVAVENITQSIREKRFQPFLLFGVTGSGKTIVYRELINGVLEAGRSALVLVPEISLTPQLSGRLKRRFGELVAVTHSGLSRSQREEVWKRVRSGQVKVVVGPRSAIFAPLSDLGVIIVDEEQDESYKQEESAPRYNARDCALKLGQLAQCPVVLGSATPDISSYWRAQSGYYTLLELKERYKSADAKEGEANVKVETTSEVKGENLTEHLPIWVVKWWGVKEGTLFSPQLRFRLNKCLEDGLQAVIVVNRRGFSTYVQCPSCGSVAKCPHCDITLRYHRDGERMECHYCGFNQGVVDRCPQCGADRLLFKGTGSQRVERELSLLYPTARVARMDRDTVRRPEALGQLLKQLAERKIDILVGTQMVAKGHDFPHIALVGILMADLEWLHPDFRSVERAFRLLVQASGRAGRGRPGEVVIQALDPTHPLLRWVQSQNYSALYNYEVVARQSLGYPPFGRLISLWVKGNERGKVDSWAKNLAAELKQELRIGKVLGPAIPLVEKLEGFYRRRLLVKFPSFLNSQVRTERSVLYQLVKRVATGRSTGDIKVWVDVDPIEV